jgi:hypothetical protein
MSTMERVLYSPTLAGTDATDSAMVAWPYTESGKLVRVYIENLTAVTASDSANITVTATQNSTTIFSRQTNLAGGNLAADTAEAQTLGASMIGEKLELDTGDAVTLAVAKAGTGPAYEFRVAFVYRFDQGA